MNRSMFRSFNFRIVLQLTLAIVIIFLVQSLVYYQIVRSATERQQELNLRQAAQELAAVIRRSTGGQGYNPLVQDYLTYAARSTGGATVLVIDRDGVLQYDSGLPPSLPGDIVRNADGSIVLPENYRRGLVSGSSGYSGYGDFQGLFSQVGGRWLSAAYPITTDFGDYRGEAQIHLRADEPTFFGFLFANGMLVALFVAFIAALLVNAILSRYIARPIRNIAEAVDKVSRGDLAVRIRSPGGDDFALLSSTLNHMIERLEHQERTRRAFISNVSHDLRTPLTSIGGFVSGMLDGTIPPERHQHYLGIVKQETGRLQLLVKTMFEGSLLDEELQIKADAFDLNELIQSDIVGLETQLANKRLKLSTDFVQDGTGKLLAIGDREAISRVFCNILINAIRFTPSGGSIHVRTRRSGRSKELEVLVDDSGPGVPEEEQPYIFDRFYMVDKSRSAKGSGLGLFICRSILNAHGQRISVGSSDLGGARFVFTLAAP